MRKIAIALLLILSFFFVACIEPAESFSSSDSTEKNMDKPVENLKVDVLVIGGGGGGLAAAAVAKGKLRDKGKVLIVEKRAITGGNTINIYSPFVPPGTKSASNPAPDLSPDEQVERANEWSHYRVDSRLVRALAEKSKNKDWLWELLSDEEKEKRIKEAEKESSMKFHDMERYATAMTELVHDLGVEILLSTPAKKLLTDKSGAVIGALAEGKDKNYKITATAVIIATGGFIGNKELMEKYFHSYSDNLYEEFYVKGQMYTGDGLLMAAEVGASVDAPTAYEWEINLMPYLAPGGDQSSGGGQGQQPSISLNLLLDNDRYPETIWINAKGQRLPIMRSGASLPCCLPADR